MQRLESNLKPISRHDATNEDGQLHSHIIIVDGKYYVKTAGLVKPGDNLVVFIKTSHPQVKLSFIVNKVNNEDFVIPHPDKFKIIQEDEKVTIKLAETIFNAVSAGKYITNVKVCRHAQPAFGESLIN